MAAIGIGAAVETGTVVVAGIETVVARVAGVGPNAVAVADGHAVKNAGNQIRKSPPGARSSPPGRASARKGNTGFGRVGRVRLSATRYRDQYSSRRTHRRPDGAQLRNSGGVFYQHTTSVRSGFEAGHYAPEHSRHDR